jgi:hypothetical protein
VFSGVYTAEDDGVGDTTMVDVQIFLEAFLSMSLRYGSFIDEAFFC